MARCALLCCLLLSSIMPLAAQEAPLLIDGEFYDLLTLKKTEESPEITLKLEPLPLEPREPVRRKDADQTLILRLLNRGQSRYEVKWEHIKQIALFEELVLDEAAELVEQERFDAAYDCFQFVSQRSPNFPGLDEALTNCLVGEAKFWAKRDRYDQALALANRAHQRKSDFDGLAGFLGELVEQLVKKQIDARNFAATRRLLAELEEKHPQHAVVRRWQNVLTTNAQKSLDAATQARQSKDLGLAHRAAFQAADLWPKLDGVADFYQSLQEEYPLISVAVSSYGPVPAASDWKSLTNWQVRRLSGLTNRLIVEPESYSATGFRYQFPLGSWKPLGKSALFQPQDGLKFNNANAMTNFDLASFFMSRAVETPGNYHPAWRQILSQVQLGDGITIDFKQPVARPEAYLQSPVVPWNRAASSPAMLLGSYKIAEADESRRRLVLHQEASSDPSQPREIVERTYADPAEAVELLISGRVAAWDRVPPWEWDRVERYDDLDLKPYASPTVHLLVPNLQNPLMRLEAFRNALFHGIHRERILNQTVFEGENVGGASLLAGPFPQGYASAGAIASQDYNPQLMLGLLSAAYQEHALNTGRDRDAAPKLVLAYPQSVVATRACREIKRFLELDAEGVEIEMLELPSGKPFPAEKQHWDLLYLEWTAFEPQDAVWRLFGPSGLVEVEHPLRLVAFEQLSTAETIEELGTALRLLDRLAQNQRLLIPLWQLREHFAQRTQLTGAGEVPVTLYQNITNWRLAPPIPSE